MPRADVEPFKVLPDQVWRIGKHKPIPFMPNPIRRQYSIGNCAKGYRTPSAF